MLEKRGIANVKTRPPMPPDETVAEVKYFASILAIWVPPEEL